MGMAEILMKQLGVDPAAIQAQFDGFVTAFNQIGAALRSILERQAAMKLQLDRIETHLLSLSPSEGSTFDEMSPSFYLEDKSNVGHASANGVNGNGGAG